VATPPSAPPPEPALPEAGHDEGLSGGPQLSRKEFAWFQKRVYDVAGIHFKDAKRTMLAARLARRVRMLALADFSHYIEYLEAEGPGGGEFAEMINAVTTNKTDFFRESHHFDFLVSDVIPRVRERAALTGRRRLTIWSAACSTGEEPYSIAMTVREHLGPLLGWDLKIVASDIDTRVLATAKEGVYAEEKLQSVPEHLRRRYFQRGRNGSAGLWRARNELKELIDFRRINLNDPLAHTAPLTASPDHRHNERFDVIFCRNVIIYFDRPTQTRLFEHIAQQLDPDGFLFLGHSESLIGVSDRFTLVRQTVHRLREAAPLSPAAKAAPVARLAPVPALPSPRLTAPARAPAPAASPAPPPPALRLKRIIVGEVFASREPVIIRTLLGSCVSASLYDPEARVGGLNHFLLPEGDEPGDRGARFGVHAMELLINEIMKLGGVRQRLVAKVFGGAHVIPGMSRAIPDGNVEFIQRFLQAEGIPVVGQRLAGNVALEVCFETSSGRAKVRPLPVVPAALRRQIEAERARLKEQSRNAEARVFLF
jgi:chemotaxis protein methyltransferase CheR